MRTHGIRGNLAGVAWFPWWRSDSPSRRGRRGSSPTALSVTLALLTSLVPVAGFVPAAQAATGGLGRPELPPHRTGTFHAVNEPGAAQARAEVARSEAADAARTRRARAEQHRAWPTAGVKSGRLAAGETDLTVGGLPVRLSQTKGSGPAGGEARVEVLGQEKAEAAGIQGVLLTAAAQEPGSAEVRVGYSSFASAFGGGWSGRLRLVELPGCAVTTPQVEACRVQTPLESRNDIAGQAVSATVPLGRSDDAGSGSATVLALVAAMGESASGSGNYAASPLSESSTWEAGGSSGAFTWSYGLDVPPAAAGPSPALSLSYNSGSVDGRTASTNNQGTLVGEGFDLTSSYIERSYDSCDQDGQSDKYDLCWKYDNASLVLNGKSSELVKDDTSGQWRLKDDDASTVTHSTGAANGAAGGEYWTVTTGDGTKYVFGLNKLEGAGTERTNSVWTVPVFGNDKGEPGYDKGSTFADRWLDQAWRWNLDYVEDLHGNAMSYWYTSEDNYYARNGSTKATAKYTRGGYLTKILYGQRSGALFTGTASDKVTFDYAERCTASDCSSLTKTTAPNWPDVPFDAICTSDADCKATSPSFFTRKRLTSIDTFAWSETAGNYTEVDSWALAQEYLDPGDIGDSSDQTLTLKSIRRTGKNGTAISLNPVTFTYKMLPNRVDGAKDDILPINRPRVYQITSETGAITSITYSPPECVRGSNMPTEDSNTQSCYPQYWHINGAKEALIDWFHKYRVIAVSTSDPTGHSDAVENTYTYSGPAWHYNDSPFTPVGERTWSMWRGYSQVTATTGVGSNQSKTVSLYLQGMDGDKKKTGTRSVSVPGINFTGLTVATQTDSDPFAGMLREQITYNGTTPIGVTVNDPWSKKTATQHKSYANTEAYYVRTAKTYNHTYLTAAAKWRTTTTETTRFDDYGMPELVYDAGDTSVTGDETCTRTWYARNTQLGINSLTSRTRVVGRACSTAETDLSLPASSSSRGDVLSDAGVVYDNPNATAWSASQTPTKGEASWTGRATAYPSTAAGGERNPSAWQTGSTTTYDMLGRVLSVADGAGNTVDTAYTPTTSGPLTRTVVTHAIKTQKTTTFIDPARGVPLRVYDLNTKLTETSYDALGRSTAVWLPNRSRTAPQSANYKFDYHLDDKNPSWVSTSTIRGNDVYNTSYAFYDSLLRPLQTQSPSANGGRLLTDTRYDSRGLAYQTYADAFDSKNAPNGTYAMVEYGGAPKQTETAYDGAGRPTTSTFYVFGVKKWSTTSSYTGDSVATTALNGGSATRVISDALGRTTERREYAGTSPNDTEYGASSGAAYTSTSYTYTRDGKPNTVTGPDKAVWSYGYDLFGRQTTATDPDAGTSTTAYTVLDQVDWTKDAAGKVLAYSYDPLGRKTGQYSSNTTKDATTQLAGWAYDTLLKGQLDSSTRYDGGKTYTKRVTAYDSLYRPTTTQLSLPATDVLVTSGAVTSTLQFSTSYNLDGTPQNISEPAAGGLSAETVNTTYNTVGLPLTVQGTNAYLLGASYSPTGQTEQLTLGPSAVAGTKKAYLSSYYEAGTDRLTMSSVTDQTHDYKLQELNYTYDDAGNVTSITDPSLLGGTTKADNQCFTYDGYQRLTEAWTPKTADCSTSGRTTANLDGPAPYWTTWTYNDAGLRTTQKDNTTGTTTQYCYGTTTYKQPHALAATTTGTTCTGVTNTYDYDQTGNTTKRPAPSEGTSETLDWYPDGHLKTLTGGAPTTANTSYLYDADGELLIRRPTTPTATGETVLYLGATEVHYSNKGASTSKWAQRYYTAAGQTIALRTNQSGTGAVSYLAGDHHGTSSLAVDATTQAVTKRYTTPFGADRGTPLYGPWPDDKGFLGKTRDTTTGLTHIGAREYDPTIGRFLSVDPILDTSDAQSLNGYAYAGNNPTTHSDPTGLRDCGETEYCGKGSRPNLEYGSAASADAKVILPNGKHVSLGGTTGGGGGGGTHHSSSGQKSGGADQGGGGFFGKLGSGLKKAASWTWENRAPIAGFIAESGTYIGCYSVAGLGAAETGGASVVAGVAGCGALAGAVGSAVENALTPDADHSTGAVLEAEANGALWGAAGAVAGEFVMAKIAGNVIGKSLRCSFTSDTPVLMENGDTKPIGKIKTGDKVETADPGSGRHEGPRVVTATHVNHDYDLIDLDIRQADGTLATIHTTYKHPFWDDTRHAWIPAGQLTVGHALNTAANTHVYVANVKVRPGDRDMYNLTVADLHTYYVLAGETPVLVHNSNCVPSTRVLPSRNAAFRSAKRDLGIPNGQQPDELRMTPMTDRSGRQIMNPDGTPVMTREYVFTRGGGDRVIIQDHSAGHYYGEGGVGDQGPHLNVRPFENARTGKVPGTAQHYEY
ncbi:HNH/endonuclease VII fold putative polymorphic toxin [Streptomyces nodosus]|uniref:HNH/endonuclease VII fold putative polymorphic toxin n=1 Tax=Streptomyces nodosus TaxID=40318 RepID=UPI00380D66C0